MARVDWNGPSCGMFSFFIASGQRRCASDSSTTRQPSQRRGRRRRQRSGIAEAGRLARNGVDSLPMEWRAGEGTPAASEVEGSGGVGGCCEGRVAFSVVCRSSRPSISGIGERISWREYFTSPSTPPFSLPLPGEQNSPEKLFAPPDAGREESAQGADARTTIGLEVGQISLSRWVSFGVALPARLRAVQAAVEFPWIFHPEWNHRSLPHEVKCLTRSVLPGAGCAPDWYEH